MVVTSQQPGADGRGKPLTVGVLALQGGVREHAEVLAGLGVDVRLVRRPEHIPGLDALVLPGGESSTMDKLLRLFDMRVPLRAAITDGLPVLGTCAGLILLADRILDAAPGQQQLGGLDVVVRRNAFGAQNQSFETDLQVPAVTDRPVHATFIRGPVVEEVGERAEVLARVADGRVVAVQQGNLVGISFHPEVAGETAFHEHLLRLAEQRRAR